MLFNSPEFICFVIIAYTMYVLLPFRQQNLMLLIVSYIFYGWWDTRFLFLVALSTTVDFWVGLMLENGRLTRAQRLLPATFLVTSAYAFLGLDFSAIWPRDSFFSSPYDLIRKDVISWISLSIAAYLLLLYFIYKTLEGSTNPRSRLCCLMVSLVTQLGLLGVFKYYNFFSDNIQAGLSLVGAGTFMPRLNVILPVGISFYTFQSLSYTIDIYRKQFKPTGRFFEFALFVAYFPQLQAGPIERGRQLIPQLSRPRVLSMAQSYDGLYLIVLGFFKKVAIADGVAPVVDKVFSSTGRVSWIDVVVGTFLFAVQIYCDFSGYIDIARGISKLLGIELVHNFNHPYFSTNARDFWHRWNISLSTWLRDYLYIPLGGSAGNLLFVCRNLMTTMLLGGLWHGAAWNYVLWGFYQGMLLCVYRILTDLEILDGLKLRMRLFRAVPKIGRHVIANFLFFILVCYGWLIFRAHSMAQIVNFTSLLVEDFGDLDYGGGAPRLSSVVGLMVLAAVEMSQYWSRNVYVHRQLVAPFRGFFVALILAITMIGMSNDPAQFIYFQF
jgi:alginate O-acetyltransferase complex protein AlgI